MKETTEFVRKVLNEITPSILQGRSILTESDKTEINLRLKKQAVQLFARGNLAESKELNGFIESMPEFLIWPGNGFNFMQKYCGDLDAAKKVIIFSSEKHINGLQELHSAIEKIIVRRNSE